MMYGDFSRWSFDPRTNFSGILHQQGRVLLDADTNDQTLLGLRWQDTAARDAFGALVLAVPASERQSFEVTAVKPDGADLEVTLRPGRAWADGLLVNLVGDPPDLSAVVTRTAAKIAGAAATAIDAIAAHQVVLLEVWRDAVSGFQVPKELIEPALGGPDTTERVATCFQLRVADALPGESCEEVARRIQDDLAGPGHGRLTATLDPTTTTSGDCPVVDHGGYSGLEHNLYLIEIAALTDASAGPHLKWSPLGGGLVGRGAIDASGEFVLRGGREAILRAGLTEVYVELLEPRPLRSGAAVTDRDCALAERWEVVYGAKATLTSDGALTFFQDYFGAPPVAGAPRACRIWHGIRPLSDFPSGLTTPNGLRDGIRLEFDLTRTYVAGDRWTFTVRAGGLANPQALLTDAPPQEIRRVRVPLARIRWEGEVAQIDDCRQVFQPLTRQQTCCRLRVGDGVRSHGDFTSIQAAVDHLPREGGEICVLPGVYQENVDISGLRYVTIRGCGPHTRISGGPRAPIFTIRDSLAVTLHGLNLRAADNQRAIHIRKSARCVVDQCMIGGNGAPAIDAEAATELRITDNLVNVRDAATTDPAVVVEALGAKILRNQITVAGKVLQSERTPPRVSRALALERPAVQSAALGGLWLRGGCQDVDVVGNTILGGRGHGITLGHLERITVQGVIVGTRLPLEPIPTDENPCPPGILWVPPPSADEDTFVIAGPPLMRITIVDNTITGMGFSGIAARAFLPTIQQGIISVCDLEIRGNTIARNLQRPLANTRQEMLSRQGYGGIILADVEDLRILSNRIVDNGVRHIEPTCGVYVLHVEGAEISRNHIINNGPRTADAGAPQPGARGGIFVALATSPVLDIDVAAGQAPASWLAVDLERRGLPAIRVCENTVAHPVGRALTINSLGPALVTDNNLTTLGVGPGAGMIFAAVQILALGLSPELLSPKATFTDLRRGRVVSRAAAAPQAPLVLIGDQPSEVSQPISEATPPTLVGNIAPVSLAIAKPPPLLLVIPTGDVLFADNQVLLDLRDGAQEAAVSAIGIFSLDDVEVSGNQASCALYGDIVWVHLMTVGMSVRVCHNRLKEPLPSAFLSGVTFGLANTTSLNQSTHCLLIRGAAKVDAGNIEAIEAITPGTCKRLDPVLTLLK